MRARCVLDGCVQLTAARGLCNRHYARWRKHGDPLAGRHLPDSRPERLLRNVDTTGEGCWLWKGALLEGYGVFNWRGAKEKAHRAVYELLEGPIPEGLELDHLCRVTACVRPSHLEPVTHAENIRRGQSPAAECARRTHCKHGHEFTEANTLPRSDGGRRCRTCDDARKTRMRDARRYANAGR